MGTLPRPLLGALLAVVAFFAVWTLALKPHAPKPDANGVSVVHAYNSAISKLHAAEAGTGVAGAATDKPAGHAAPARPTRSAVPAGPAAPAHPAVNGTTATATKTGAATGHRSSVPAVHPAARPLGPDGHHAALLNRHAAATPAPAASSTKPAAPRPVLPAALSANVLAQQRVAQLDSALRAGRVIALLFYNPSAADDLAVRQALAAVPARSGLTKLAVPITELSRFSVVTNQVPVTASPTVVVIDGRHQASTLVGFVDPLELGKLIDDAFAAR